MKSAAEYRRHALECRTLAKRMQQAESREQLLEMAAIWDRLADQREKDVQAEDRSEAEPEGSLTRRGEVPRDRGT